MTSVIRAGSSVGCRSRRRCITNAAMSSGRVSLRLPPKEPIGVRTPSTIYASLMPNILREQLALRPIHRASKQGNNRVLLRTDRDAIKRETAPDPFFDRDGRQNI